MGEPQKARYPCRNKAQQSVNGGVAGEQKATARVVVVVVGVGVVVEIRAQRDECRPDRDLQSHLQTGDCATRRRGSIADAGGPRR